MLAGRRDASASARSHMRMPNACCRMTLAAMMTRSPDTDADSDRPQIRILRARPVGQRIAQIDWLNAMAEAFTMAGLRRAHRGATEARLRKLVRDQRLRSAHHAVGIRACTAEDDSSNSSSSISPGCVGAGCPRTTNLETPFRVC